MSKTAVKVLRKAAVMIREAKVSCTCTALGRVESKGREKANSEPLFCWWTPGPVGKLWEDAHKPAHSSAATAWLGTSFNADEQELRETLLEEMALNLEAQGFA